MVYLVSEWTTRHFVFFFLIVFNVYLFLRQRETEHEWGEGQRERETQNRKQAPSCQHRARRRDRTREPRDHDLSRSRTLNRLSHPGTPLIFLNHTIQGRLGGSISHASNFGSGHELVVWEFRPRIRLSAVSIGPTLDPLSPCLSAPPPLTLTLSKKIKKMFPFKKTQMGCLGGSVG